MFEYAIREIGKAAIHDECPYCRAWLRLARSRKLKGREQLLILRRVNNFGSWDIIGIMEKPDDWIKLSISVNDGCPNI